MTNKDTIAAIAIEALKRISALGPDDSDGFAKTIASQAMHKIQGPDYGSVEEKLLEASFIKYPDTTGGQNL